MRRPGVGAGRRGGFRGLGGGGGGGGGLPANTVPPSIAGTVAHGSVLTATPGTWTGSPSLTYQWYAGASPISGATGTTYTCDRADGICGADYIRCVETDSVGATSVDSNDLVYDGADLPLYGFSLDEDVTVVGGEVDSVASSFGALSATASAPSSTQRPVYDATGGAGGRARMLSDGTDDVLLAPITKGSAFSDHEIGYVGAVETDSGTSGTISVAYFDNVASKRFALEQQAGSVIRFSVTGAANVTFSTEQSTVGHWSGDSAGSTETARLNGTSEGTPGAVAVPSRADGGTLAIAGDLSGGNAADADYRAIYIGEALTADQRTDLSDLLTRRTGVTS